MHINLEKLAPTKLKLTIVPTTAELDDIKQVVLRRLSDKVKVQGFREGKAPLNLVEKQLDPNLLQTEVLETAVNQLFVKAVEDQKLRPVNQPQINVTKFVPFNDLEFTVEVEAVGDVQLPDYKKIKVVRQEVKITAEQVNDVVDSFRMRAAEKKEVDRAAKVGDEVLIDFKGVDAKTKEPIAGADGVDYPLILGSNSFIPGFEDAVVGVKAGEEKTFPLTFPKDYGVAALQSKKVEFTVTVKAVNELNKPKLDDVFAATMGPFKTVAELKKAVKDQLQAEQKQQAERNLENELLDKIASKTTMDIPDSLIEDEITRLEDEERRNLTYKGQTWQEHLDEEGLTGEQHRAKQRPVAEQRVKVSLVLGAISEAEGLDVTPEELEVRTMLLKQQYTDPAMQTELDNPNNRRELASRLLTEKTLEKLKSYNT